MARIYTIGFKLDNLVKAQVLQAEYYILKTIKIGVLKKIKL